MMRDFLLILLFVVVVATASDSNSQITNGKQIGKLVEKSIVNKGEYPFVVYLEIIIRRKHNKSTNICGGSLIRSDAILTAAHCVAGKRTMDVSIYAGLLHTSIDHEVIQIRDASQIYIHENYSASFQPPLNDIGLVFVDEPLEFTKHVGLIDLPTNADYMSGVKATVFGWGRNEHGNYPDWLHKTEMTQIQNKLCQNFADEAGAKHFKQHKITSDMMCAIDQFKSTVCLGDSGGPMVYNNKVIGIVSFGWGVKRLAATKQTCREYYPAVFVKVANYLEWISQALISAYPNVIEDNYI